MIYFDNAATTLQKPQTVSRAVLSAMQTMTTPGRGNHKSAQLAADTAFQCREIASEMFGVPAIENVVFTMNATHALNIAIRSLVPQGGHVVISGYEHNAVTRTLRDLGAKVEIASAPLFQTDLQLQAFEAKIVQGVDAVICTHVSNVFGFVLPIEEIAFCCQKLHIPLIVDASQSAGILPLDMQKLGAHFIAMPGHKGLYGPQGTGLLLCMSEAKPLISGGTGSDSLRQEMPPFLPDRLEAGTHNMPGIAGLKAGMRFIEKTTSERILRHEQKMLEEAASVLYALPNIHLFYSAHGNQVGVLSFRHETYSAELLAELLAQEGIAVRAGLHCAPLAHRTAHTESDGTVRISFSAFNTKAEVRYFDEAMKRVLRRAKKY